jgi:hypothetical protein
MDPLTIGLLLFGKWAGTRMSKALDRSTCSRCRARTDKSMNCCNRPVCETCLRHMVSPLGGGRGRFTCTFCGHSTID